MKIIFTNLIFSLLFLTFLFEPARGEISVGFGPEYFLWREFNTNGSQALDESGFRGTLNLNVEENRNQDFLFAYAGKLYFGTVLYNGQTLFPPYQPVNTDTSYIGFQNEGKLVFRQPMKNQFSLDLVTSLGWDHWTRNIDPGHSNQLEKYDIVFLKFGPLFSHLNENKPWIGFGLKFPVLTFEDAHINSLGFDQNPILHPGGQVSFFFNIGYSITTHWELQFYYDSYRFSESPKENVTSSVVSSGQVFQPQSDMDLFGALAMFRFP